MFPSLWSKGEEKKRRQLMEEDTNREGHWCRDFTVRTDSWLIIESWAKEHGFRLVALKGRRRLYRKGDDPNYYNTYVDIRHDEGRIVLASWITVGFRLRALQLFMIPSELLVEPLGSWKGIGVRRRTCRALNTLLIRLKQPEILGSNSFHISDIDASTLTLSALLLIPLHAFLLIHIFKFEVRVGLSNLLLSNIAVKLQLLLGVSVAAIAIHHFVVRRWASALWMKAISVTALVLIVSTLTVFYGTRTAHENLYSQLTYHCFLNTDDVRCQEVLQRIPEKDRERLAQKVEVFRKNLANRK